MKNVQCRAIATARALTDIDSEQVQARKKEWERQQKKQHLLNQVNVLLGQHK